MGSCHSSKNEAFFYERAGTVAMKHINMGTKRQSHHQRVYSSSVKSAYKNYHDHLDTAKSMTHMDIDTKYKEINEYTQMRKSTNTFPYTPDPQHSEGNNSISNETVKITPDQDPDSNSNSISNSNQEKFIRSRDVDEEEESKTVCDLKLEYISTDGHHRVHSKLSMDFTNTDIHIDDDTMIDSPTSPVTAKPLRTTISIDVGDEITECYISKQNTVFFLNDINYYAIKLYNNESLNVGKYHSYEKQNEILNSANCRSKSIAFINHTNFVPFINNKLCVISGDKLFNLFIEIAKVYIKQGNDGWDVIKYPLSVQNFALILVLTVILQQMCQHDGDGVVNIDLSDIVGSIEHFAIWCVRSFGDIKHKRDKISHSDEIYTEKLNITCDDYSHKLSEWMSKYVEEDDKSCYRTKSFDEAIDVACKLNYMARY